MSYIFMNLQDAIPVAGARLRRLGTTVHANSWQGVKPPAPMHEVLGISIRTAVPEGIEQLRREVEPNLPWADLHFDERVGRRATNPGEAYKHWPWFNPDVNPKERFHENGQFTHTYQERIWPPINLRGIRFNYGDLEDVVALLHRDSLTRQAFLPIWFPEDTGAKHGGRVPCTLGYWFVFRRGHLHITYYIRSCDYFRHFRDDVYLACRLLHWVLDELREQDPTLWRDARPGFLDMHIGSLHCWEPEVKQLPEE